MAGTLKAAALVAALSGLGASEAQAVDLKAEMVAGVKVFTYSWTDSIGRKRSVSLKREGEGNPGHGGYAVQMTYQYLDIDGLETRKALAPDTEDGGFGYFVAHERDRTFADGTKASIAKKIFNADDAPLGRTFPVRIARVANQENYKSVEFRLDYPMYGTVNPGGLDPTTGQDKPPLKTDPTKYRLYSLPVTIRWAFEDGKDYPRVSTRVGLGRLPGANRVSFDMRGPLGKIDFEVGNFSIKRAKWGDRFHFENKGRRTILTRGSNWVWGQANEGARYNSLIAGNFEMGLFEPRPFIESATNDGYAAARGKNYLNYNNGKGCPTQDQLLPCDLDWPYQSSQSELPRSRNVGTTSEKIGWGSSPYYGTSLSATNDGTTSTPFDGFPASKTLVYDICVVTGYSPATDDRTKQAARGAEFYNCASGGF